MTTAPPATPTISFLTDYGLADEFVGVCRSVIRQLSPAAHVIDVTHDIAAHDVRAGSLALVRAVQYLADGVVLAIVDPGVGTARRAIAVEAGPMIFVGPDNGLLAPAVAMLGGATRAVSLTNEDHHLSAPGATFAGRDIFSPVAAQLANGLDLAEFGEIIDAAGLVPGMVPLTRSEEGVVHAEVLWVDRYGNAQLNVDPDEVEEMGDTISLEFAGTTRTAHRAETYASIKTGAIGLVVDSYGLLSVCLDRRSASSDLGLGAGAGVLLSEPKN
jgi:S-adenosyl-L-methionine hydrolase (adenosine-forming)